MKKFLAALALVFTATATYASDFASCPVDSTTIDPSYARYVAFTTTTGYSLHRQTTSVLRDITFSGEAALIKAVQNGVVVYVSSYDTGDGAFIGIKHTRGDGTVWFSQYNRITSPLVSTGETVGAGQTIATLAKTPCASTFSFSTTVRNLNSAATLPVTGYGLFPGVFTDAGPGLRAACK